MPAGKGGKEGGEGPIKYVLGLGAFDDDTWVDKAGAALPKLGTISVVSGGSTNTGNGPRKEKPAPHDREGGDRPDAGDSTPGDLGQDDTLGEDNEASIGNPDFGMGKGGGADSGGSDSAGSDSAGGTGDEPG
jgi:hypothetical protein